MHEHFPDWYKDAGLEINPETSPKHWKAINEYRPEIAEIISFARVFYGSSKQEDKTLDKFGAALQEADPTLSMRDSKQLISLLAGIELVAVIERNDDKSLANLAALCLVCGAAQGVRTAVPVPPMPGIAARYIENRTGKRLSMSAGTGKEEGDPKVIKLERELTIVSEEVDMMWWLVSEYSRDRNQSWKIVKLPGTTIIAGKELADLTRIIPGPVAAAAFLDRIVRLSDSAKSQKAIQIKDTIEKTPREWREQYELKTWPYGLEDLMPISNGIKLSLTVSEGDEWSPVFEKGTAIAADSQLLPNVLAYQVFLEHLLARLPGEIE